MVEKKILLQVENQVITQEFNLHTVSEATQKYVESGCINLMPPCGCGRTLIFFAGIHHFYYDDDHAGVCL